MTRFCNLCLGFSHVKRISQIFSLRTPKASLASPLSRAKLAERRLARLGPMRCRNQRATAGLVKEKVFSV